MKKLDNNDIKRLRVSKQTTSRRVYNIPQVTTMRDGQEQWVVTNHGDLRHYKKESGQVWESRYKKYTGYPQSGGWVIGEKEIKTDYVVLSSELSRITVKDDNQKTRVEYGKLGDDGYGLRGYASDGSTELLALFGNSNRLGGANGWLIESGYLTGNGGVIRTASSGQRVEISASRTSFYNTAGMLGGYLRARDDYLDLMSINGLRIDGSVESASGNSVDFKDNICFLKYVFPFWIGTTTIRNDGTMYVDSTASFNKGIYVSASSRFYKHVRLKSVSVDDKSVFSSGVTFNGIADFNSNVNIDGTYFYINSASTYVNGILQILGHTSASSIFVNNALSVSTEAKFGSSASYTKFGAIGHQTMSGGARVYRELWLDANSFQAPGTKPATLVDYGITSAWEFSDMTDDTLYAKIHVPDNVDDSEDMDIYILWSTGAISEYCYWQVETLYRAEGEAANSTTVDSTLTNRVQCSGTPHGLKETNIGSVSHFSSTDKILNMRIKRRANTASDTLGTEAYLLGIYVKYVSDKIGVHV